LKAMRRFCRPLAPNEMDFEGWFLFGSVALAVGCSTWFAWGLPWPKCWIHHLLGIPCPTCGSTRCALALARGDLRRAIALNPLMFSAYAATIGFDLYASVVLLFELPRIRFGSLPAKIKRGLGTILVVAIVVNWLYLLTNH
jgi:uncharacterized protein DUF2752